MSAFKPYPELQVEASEDPRTNFSIITAVNGSEFGLHSDRQRMVECWNVLRKVAFPAAHVAALEDRVERLETLRKEAWARVQELEAVQNA